MRDKNLEVGRSKKVYCKIYQGPPHNPHSFKEREQLYPSN